VVVAHNRNISQRKAFTDAARKAPIAMHDTASGSVRNLNAWNQTLISILKVKSQNRRNIWNYGGADVRTTHPCVNLL
jgi:hypothetical protein